MNAKLTPTDAQNIRQWAALGYSQAAIAREYGISSANVRLILRRKIWGHV